MVQNNNGNLNYSQWLYIKSVPITNSGINLNNIYIEYADYDSNDESSNINGQYYLAINIDYTSNGFNFRIQVPKLVINID